MNAPSLLLAATLALAGLPALAADHDHGATTAAPAAPSDGEDAQGCRMMMKKKPGKAAGNAGAAEGKSGMCACMAKGGAGMQPGLLEPALPAARVPTLGLDAGQRERLAALEKRHRVQQWALLGDLREERLALAEQLAVPEPDPATATARLRAVQDLEARLFEARLAARREALALLTADQRARLAAPPASAAGAATSGVHDHGSAAAKDGASDDKEAPVEADPHAGHR